MSIPTFNHLWRIFLQNASFRGAGFKVESDGKGSGRRLVGFEFPKQNSGYVEDMGRRLRHYRMTGYVIQGPQTMDIASGTGGNDYQTLRDVLIAALEADGPALLIHPTLGTDTVFCDHYTLQETKQKGGMATFEMEFIEAGITIAPPPNQAAAVQAAAQTAFAAFSQSVAIHNLK